MFKPYSLDGTIITKRGKPICHCQTIDIASEIATLLNTQAYRLSKAAVNKLNTELQAILKPIYFTNLPVDEIREIINRNGFNADELTNASLSGDTDRINVPVGDNVYFMLTWYRMESGRYETVAYFHN